MEYENENDYTDVHSFDIVDVYIDYECVLDDFWHKKRRVITTRLPIVCRKNLL